MLVLLATGMLVKPVLAIACEIHDIGQSTVIDAVAAVGEAPAAAEDCCALRHCNNCCSHTVALPTLLGDPSTTVLDTAALPAPSAHFVPITLPVALRPPIAA